MTDICWYNLGFNVLEKELKQNLQLLRKIISAKIHESNGIILFNLRIGHLLPNLSSILSFYVKYFETKGRLFTCCFSKKIVPF